jgi:hypothetical protein
VADEKDPSELGTPEDPQPTGAPAESAAVSEEDAEELRKRAAEHALAEAEAAEVGEASGAVPEDVLTQEALARRVAALGEHDATEAIAREEEDKLAARRKAARSRKSAGKTGGKSALETAASKRLGKIGTRAVPKPRDPATTDLDPVLDRTVALRKWVTDHARVVQFGALAVVVALAGGLGWISYQNKREESASAALSAAVADEHGRIGDPDKEDDADAPKDPRPIFKTLDARTDSALAKYREVEAKYSGTGAAILSRLGEGALLLDKHDADGAVAAFTDVKGSALAKADAEVRGRAIEGLGMAYELSSVLKPEQAAAAQDKALAAYKELENTVDVLGFHELGMYEQARVLQAKGDKEHAIEQLKALHERLAKPGESAPFPYLEEVADDRLRQLDPMAVPPKTPAFNMGGMGGAGGGGGLPGGIAGMSGGTPEQQEQLRKLMEQLKQRQPQGGDKK